MRKNYAYSLRNTLMAASVLAVYATAPTIARSEEDHTINISGTAVQSCVLPAADAHTLDFGELTNEIDGTIIPITTPVPIGSMSCNYGIALALRTQNGALTRTTSFGTLPANFTDKVHYTATVDWGGSTFTLTTDGTLLKTTNSTLGPRNDSLVVNVTTLANPTKKLVSGNYSDVLTLRIGGVF